MTFIMSCAQGSASLAGDLADWVVKSSNIWLLCILLSAHDAQMQYPSKPSRCRRHVLTSCFNAGTLTAHEHLRYRQSALGLGHP